MTPVEQPDDAFDHEGFWRDMELMRAAGDRGETIALDPAAVTAAVARGVPLELDAMTRAGAIQRLHVIVAKPAIDTPRAVGQPRAREHRASRSHRARAPGDPDREPPQRWEVHAALLISRPMNGHRKWEDSRIFHEVVLVDPDWLDAPRRPDAIAFRDEKPKRNPSFCSHCNTPFGAEHVQATGRSWCKRWDSERRKRQTSYKAARAAHVTDESQNTARGLGRAGTAPK